MLMNKGKDKSMNKIKYSRIKNVDKDISQLVLGTMVLTNDKVKEGFGLLDDVYALGVTTFDCAAVYSDGESEQVLGKWVNTRNLRDKVAIISKCAHPNSFRNRVTSFDIMADVNDSLARLATSYIDIYFLHRDDIAVPVANIVDTLNRLYESGKIKSYGGSNWTYERIEEANEYAYKYGLQPFTVTSPNFSLARQVENPWGPGCETLTGPDKQSARDYYRKNNISVFAYSSLGRGMLSGAFRSDDMKKANQILDDAAKKGYLHEENIERLKRAEILAEKYKASVPQIALAWILKKDLPVFPIIGAVNKEQMKENIDAMDIDLTDKECRWLDLDENQI